MLTSLLIAVPNSAFQKPVAGEYLYLVSMCSVNNFSIVPTYIVKIMYDKLTNFITFKKSNTSITIGI